MTANKKRQIVENALAKGNGILRLEPAWVARDFLPPGRRLGLKEEEYDVGERGWISERWLGSTTKADNRIGPPDEGLSYIALEGDERITLKEAVEVAGPAIMGEEYAKTHKGLGRLAKIYDFADRIPYHLHQMRKDAALVGANPKEEAYYFPEDVALGPHPESFFGVHPYIAEQKKYDILLPYVVEWKDDLILRHSRAYLLVPGEGFHLPPGCCTHRARRSPSSCKRTQSPRRRTGRTGADPGAVQAGGNSRPHLERSGRHGAASAPGSGARCPRAFCRPLVGPPGRNGRTQAVARAPNR